LGDSAAAESTQIPEAKNFFPQQIFPYYNTAASKYLKKDYITSITINLCTNNMYITRVA
jgi:hypothetical protein